MIYDNIIILFSGATVGLILFQTIVIAPTFFKTLEIENSRKLLRIIFPKFFIFIVVINLASIFISVIWGINYKTISTLAAITLIATLCYFLIPATNKSSDDNNKKKFKLLHSLSVISTLIILLLCISQIFLIVRPTEEILWYEKNDLLYNFRPINGSIQLGVVHDL